MSDRKSFPMRLPFVPAAKKNRPRILWRRHRHGKRVPYVAPSEEAEGDENEITMLVRQAIALRGLSRPVFRDHDVRVEFTYLARSGLLDFEVIDLAPRPKGFTGRQRDVQNIPAVVLDALEDELFVDDNQVAEMTIRRILE